MTHNLNLKQVYFNLIKQKIKTFEVRLYDEKRKQISIGDDLVFTCESTGEKLCVAVTSLLKFESFEKMATSLPSRLIGFENKTVNEIVDTYHEFYTPQKEKENGVLAIEIKVKENTNG